MKASARPGSRDEAGLIGIRRSLFRVAYHARLALLWSRSLRHRWYESVDRDCSGRQQLWKWLAGGNGLLLLVPHLGDFDLVGCWLAEQVGAPVTVPVRKPSRFRIDLRAYARIRRAGGLTTQYCDETSMGSVVGALARGDVVVLFVDHGVSSRRVEVELFGQTRSFSTAAASIAQHSPARVVVAGTITRRGQRTVMLSAIHDGAQDAVNEDPGDFADRMARALISMIRLAPWQWHGG